MFGPDSGKHGIEGLPLCFCPVRAEPATVETFRNTFVSMGLRVYDLSPEEHDRKAAYTQGITHFIGRVLDLLHLEPSEIGTLGYAKLLEIVDQTCHDPMQLFYDLQRYNPYTDEMRRRLSDAFNRVRAALESGNLDTTSVTNVQ
jgi:prephenate dehydrogenase